MIPNATGWVLSFFSFMDTASRLITARAFPLEKSQCIALLVQIKYYIIVWVEVNTLYLRSKLNLQKMDDFCFLSYFLVEIRMHE